MFSKKNWLTVLAVITTMLLLVACGSKDTVSDTIVDDSDGPQDGLPQEFMPISEGFEEYSVWINTSDNPDRDSSVLELFVFQNEEVTYYYNFSDRVKIEDINDLTDDEIIQHVEEVAQNKYTGKYTLDLTLDNVGQNTENIDVILENYTYIWTFPLQDLIDESEFSNKDEYIADLEEKGRDFEIDGDYITFTSIEEGPTSILSINGGRVSQKIFDTSYAGLRSDDDSLLTRVDETFNGFKVDDSDTKSANVTIEGK